ncbi:MAG: class I SAM-dependent methyltransferase [Chloroflexaceae bacterium]|jgi:SAM-dependent methyltransferase|nr:class I SAM-dependent methyltransferase [Chloroflexaceae bacterium]
MDETSRSVPPDDPQALREQNRRSWEAVVPAHFSHHADLAGFLRGGGRTVFPEELELLGDLQGATLLHLMCNTGQDTLSLALLGAHVTGVDISKEAIARAQTLAAQVGVAAQFEQADVYAWLATAAAEGRRFSHVFCSYGAVCWLNDLAAFAAGVAAVLAPGGRFVLLEFHPASNMFDSNWHLSRSYPAGGRMLPLHGIDDYVGASAGGLTPDGYAEGQCDFQNSEPCYLFQWGVGEVVTALATAGLHIEALREYPFCNGERPFAHMRELPGRRWAAPAGAPDVPLMYGVIARKA